jgi:hypothetical protein
VKARAEDLLERADDLLRRAGTSGDEVRRQAARRGASVATEAARLALESRAPVREATEQVARAAAQAGEVVAGKARRPLRLRHLVRPAAFVLGALVAYRRWGRAWVASWGSTALERKAPLPGDQIVKVAQRSSTRAVTIDAPVEHVWPWLVQLGQGRGGLYSYDWLENLVGCDIHSSDQVIPELQDLAPGDEIRLVRPDYPVDLSFEVAEVEPEHALVLKTPGEHLTVVGSGFPYASWAFVLRPQGPSSTRLLVRWRSDFKDTAASRMWNGWGVELPHFVMERKMLLGIKERAEGEWRGAGGSGPATGTVTSSA